MRVVINRGKVVSLNELPQKSIALDGYVQGPEIDAENERFSFDHHDKCVRFATRSTCGQVLDALSLGLDISGFTAYVNDIDGDTVMSVWLLMHPEKHTQDNVRRLVEQVNHMDAHGPSYGGIDQSIIHSFFEGVMEPVARTHRDKSYETCNLTDLLSECLVNLDKYFIGELSVPHPFDLAGKTYKLLHHSTDHDFVIVQSDVFIADKLYADGFKRFVQATELPNGTWRYTIGKKSEFVGNFPVGPVARYGSLLHALNELEPGWGGGSTIGGSPRNADGTSSKIPPSQLFTYLKGFLTIAK